MSYWHNNYRKFSNLFLRSDPQKLSYFIIVDSIIAVLLGTFEIALLYRLTESMGSIVIMYILSNLVAFLVFTQIPLLFPRVNIGKLLRFGILVEIIIILYQILFFSSLTNPYILMLFIALRGALVGIQTFNFKYGRMVLLEDNERDEFSLDLLAIQNLLPVLMPVLAGYVVSHFTLDILPSNPVLPQGYFPLFVVALIFSISSFFFAPKISIVKEFNVSWRTAIKSLALKDVADIRRYTVFEQFKSNSLMLAGLLLTFFVLENEFNLGIYMSLISLVSIVYFEMVKKIKIRRDEKRERFILMGAIAEFVSRWIFLFNYNLWGLLIRSALNTFIISLKTLFSSNILEHDLEATAKRHKLSKADMLLVQEFYAFFARMMSYVFIFSLISFTTFNAETISMFIFAIFSIGGFIDYLLLTSIKTDRRKHKRAALQV